MTARPCDHALFGAETTVLAAARRRGINLAVWQRRLSPALARLTAGIAETQQGGICLYAGAGDAAAAIAAALGETGWGCPTRLAPLADDITRLTHLFLGICGSNRVHIDLSVLRGDACRFFHVDVVDLRLLSTYAGPGTEWLENGAVRRDALGSGSNAAVIGDGACIHRLADGWVGLFRGEADAANAGNGIVHRSAPVRQAGLRRLLLRIDMPGRHLPPDPDEPASEIMA